MAINREYTWADIERAYPESSAAWDLIDNPPRFGGFTIGADGSLYVNDADCGNQRESIGMCRCMYWNENRKRWVPT